MLAWQYSLKSLFFSVVICAFFGGRARAAQQMHLYSSVSVWQSRRARIVGRAKLRSSTVRSVPFLTCVARGVMPQLFSPSLELLPVSVSWGSDIFTKFSLWGWRRGLGPSNLSSKYTQRTRQTDAAHPYSSGKPSTLFYDVIWVVQHCR